MGLFNKLFQKNSASDRNVKITSSEKPVTPVLQELNQQEIDFIGHNADIAKQFLDIYKIAIHPAQFHPDNIGNFIYQWYETDIRGNAAVSEDKLSNCMAAAWGQYLMTHLKMQWKVITDSYGTEIGLYHPNHEVTIFPFQSMAKAIKTKDYKLPSEITKRTEMIINHQ